MRVMTHAALFEDSGLVRMDPGETILLMTIETAAFEYETAAPI